MVFAMKGKVLFIPANAKEKYSIKEVRLDDEGGWLDKYTYETLCSEISTQKVSLISCVNIKDQFPLLVIIADADAAATRKAFNPRASALFHAPTEVAITDNVGNKTTGPDSEELPLTIKFEDYLSSFLVNEEVNNSRPGNSIKSAVVEYIKGDVYLVSLGEYRNNLYPLSDFVISRIMNSNIFDEYSFSWEEREWHLLRELDKSFDSPDKICNSALKLAIYDLIKTRQG